MTISAIFSKKSLQCSPWTSHLEYRNGVWTTSEQKAYMHYMKCHYNHMKILVSLGNGLVKNNEISHLQNVFELHTCKKVWIVRISLYEILSGKKNYHLKLKTFLFSLACLTSHLWSWFQMTWLYINPVQWCPESSERKRNNRGMHSAMEALLQGRLGLFRTQQAPNHH